MTPNQSPTPTPGPLHTNTPAEDATRPFRWGGCLYLPDSRYGPVPGPPGPLSCHPADLAPSAQFIPFPFLGRAMRWGSQRWEPPPPPLRGAAPALPGRLAAPAVPTRPDRQRSEGGAASTCPRCGLGIRSRPAGGQGLELEGAGPGAGETGPSGIVKSCDRYDSAPHTVRRPPHQPGRLAAGLHPRRRGAGLFTTYHHGRERSRPPPTTED